MAFFLVFYFCSCCEFSLDSLPLAREQYTSQGGYVLRRIAVFRSESKWTPLFS